MPVHKDYLDSFAQLSRARSEDDRRSLWRQGMATLARAAVAQRPVPLEGINPQVLLRAVNTALATGLLDDLDWLSAPAAAAAVYELAAAIPMGRERRQLGRLVLERLHQGDAATFAVLAASLAAEARRALTGPPIRARVALALWLPIGTGTRADALALTLISRRDLRHEWLVEPSMGGLPARRMAARVLERASREAIRRAAEGDHSCLRVFQEADVSEAWRRLFSDRESLVWRHVAVARGLLSNMFAEWSDEITRHLQPHLTPSEWRRAAVSLAAHMGLDPDAGFERCRQLLQNEALRRDSGLAGTMVYGLGSAAEVEPEAAEALLDHLVRVGSLEAAEALVEVRREHLGGNFGLRASESARDWLQKLLSMGAMDDDGRWALAEALVEELGPERERGESALRDQLDNALMAFVEHSAHQAHLEAQSVLQAAVGKVVQLEQSRQSNPEGRRFAFRAVRELDRALLENSTLGDLLMIGPAGKQGAAPAIVFGDLFSRLTTWLLNAEMQPVRARGSVRHLTLRLRRMRTLLHLVDADGSYDEEMTEQRKERRVRTAGVLFARARLEAPSPLKRVVCASLARTCDALVRERLYEISDVFVALADSLSSEQDMLTVAEASMIPELSSLMEAYVRLVQAIQQKGAAGRRMRAAMDALDQLAQALSWASTLRVGAFRSALLSLGLDLETVARAGTLQDLTGGREGSAIASLASSVAALAQLTVGARWRLVDRGQSDIPASGSMFRALDLAIEKQMSAPSDTMRDAFPAVFDTLREELPAAIAEVVIITLERIPRLVRSDFGLGGDSLALPSPRAAPLPAWLPAHRMLGGFYVLRALGAGGVASVFVARRAEQRHETSAELFALKVPDYNAEAARTLSEEEFLRLFRLEAGALLSLPIHPNLASFVTFDAGVRPKPILVMELVEGPTLERAIERRDLDMGRACALLEGVGAGLVSMHDVGIGHLDVKPSNVILRHPSAAPNMAWKGPDGVSAQPVTPVLVDFGLAGRHLRPGCATGPYGAPEIWAVGSDNRDEQLPMAADIYAYACMAFEVFTAQTLFEAANELATISAHLSHDGYPTKLVELAKHANRLSGVRQLCDLIATALRQHPEDRISVEQFRRGLQRLAPSLCELSWPLGAADG